MKKQLFNSIFMLTSLLVNAQNPSINLAPCTPRMVLMEESCAKNCGPCYDHCTKKINTLYAANINKMAMVVYNQAPIGVGKFGETTKPYDGFHNTFGIGYQSSVMIDRTFFPNNYNSQEGTGVEVVEDEKKAFDAQMAAAYCPVSIGITNTYNIQSRQVNINVSANFCDTATGDIRIYLVLTQDTVKGPAGYDYAQNVNASVGQMLDGRPVVTFPGQIGNYVNSFPFINVVKYQPSGFFGNAGIIPVKPVAGTNYTENFSFTLPLKNSPTEGMDIDPNRIQIVAAVVRSGPFNKRQVLNANKKYLVNAVAGVAESVKNDFNFTVNSLVTNNTLDLVYSGAESGKGTLNIYNAAGEIVKMIGGLEYEQNLVTKSIDVAELADGIYFASFKASNEVFYTRKFVIAR